MVGSEGDRQLGLWIRQRRIERGLTQHVLAELLGLSRRWLVDVEAGSLQPKFVDMLRLIEILRADICEVPGVARSRFAPDARKLVEQEGDEANRREFIGWIAATAGSAALVDVERLASPLVDAAWLAEAERVTMDLDAQRTTMAAASLLPAILGHLASLEALLPATAEVAARTALLAGNQLVRAQRGPAYRCFVLAEALGNPMVRAKSMNGRAVVCGRRGDLAGALALQGQAVALLGRHAPMLGGALLARRVELHATVGEDAAAMRDLDAAERLMAGEYEWWYGDPQTPVELGAYRGAVLSTLGRYGEAVDSLNWVLERMDPGKVMWRAAVTADRDAALAML
jgi:transcriptional regulator with XRE-family HTH domain